MVCRANAGHPRRLSTNIIDRLALHVDARHGGNASDRSGENESAKFHGELDICLSETMTEDPPSMKEHQWRDRLIRSTITANLNRFFHHDCTASERPVQPLKLIIQGRYRVYQCPAMMEGVQCIHKPL